MLRELARDYQLHLIIALPVIWFIVFKYLPEALAKFGEAGGFLEERTDGG